MSKKIKVLHLLPNLSGGGAEKLCQQILKGLDKEKFEASLLLFYDKKEIGKKEKESLKKQGIKVISIKKRCLFDFINFYKIVLNIKKIKPDILHCHLGADIYGPLATYFISRKIKIISTEHNLNKSEKRIANIFKKFTVKKIDKICAVSLAVKRDAISRYNIDPEKISLVYNGIDINYYNSHTKNYNNLKREKIVFGAMGRLSKQKGHSTLIKAFSQLKNHNYQLEIAGKGELENQLKEEIVKYKLEDKVKLLGQVNSRKWLNSIDIFVMPSLWEGLGLAILEAIACKKPIIASSVDGILEVLDSNRAFLFEKNNYHELTDKLEYLANNLNTKEIEEKIEKNYQLLQEKFSLKIMIENYQNIYENITSQ